MIAHTKNEGGRRMLRVLLRAGGVVAASSAFIVGGLASAATTQQQTKEIRSKFSQILKDPSSVQLQVVTSKPGVICGRYNAKNSYGAYVGFKSFKYQVGTLYTVGTIIRSDGITLDVDAVTARKPSDMEGIQAMMRDSKAIMDEVEAAFAKC